MVDAPAVHVNFPSAVSTVPGPPGGNGDTVTTRAALAAVTGFAVSDSYYLSEAGYEGHFRFSATNLSAQVASDPGQFNYIAPASSPTGSSGAWVRIVDQQELEADRRYAYLLSLHSSDPQHFAAITWENTAFVGHSAIASSANLSGDYADIIVDVALPNYTDQALFSRFASAAETALSAANSSFLFVIDSSGALVFGKWASGGAFTQIASSAALSSMIESWQRCQLRVTVNAHASNTIQGLTPGQVKFWVKRHGATAWTQLGTTQTIAATGISLPSSGAGFSGYYAGTIANSGGSFGLPNRMVGRFYEARLSDGAGAVLVNPVFSSLPVVVRKTFADPENQFMDRAGVPNQWSLNCAICSESRLSGEVWGRLNRTGTLKIKAVDLIPDAGARPTFWTSYDEADVAGQIAYTKSLGANCVKVVSSGVPLFGGLFYPPAAAHEALIKHFTDTCRAQGMRIYLNLGNTGYDIGGDTGSPAETESQTDAQAAHLLVWMQYAHDLLIGVDLCNESWFGFGGFKPAAWPADNIDYANPAMFSALALMVKKARAVAPNLPLAISQYMSGASMYADSALIRMAVVLGLDVIDVHPYDSQQNNLAQTNGDAPSQANFNTLMNLPYMVGQRHFIGEWGIRAENSTAVKNFAIGAVGDIGNTAQGHGGVYFGYQDYPIPDLSVERFGLIDDPDMEAAFANEWPNP